MSLLTVVKPTLRRIIANGGFSSYVIVNSSETMDEVTGMLEEFSSYVIVNSSETKDASHEYKKIVFELCHC